LNTREHGDTERGLNYQGKTPLDYQHKVLKMKNRKVKQFLSGSGYSGSVEGIRKE
jgi:hypothetical protein